MSSSPCSQLLSPKGGGAGRGEECRTSPGSPLCAPPPAGFPSNLKHAATDPAQLSFDFQTQVNNSSFSFWQPRRAELQAADRPSTELAQVRELPVCPYTVLPSPLCHQRKTPGERLPSAPFLCQGTGEQKGFISLPRLGLQGWSSRGTCMKRPVMSWKLL